MVLNCCEGRAKQMPKDNYASSPRKRESMGYVEFRVTAFWPNRGLPNGIVLVMLYGVRMN